LQAQVTKPQRVIKMPYIEETGEKAIEQQFRQWAGVMHDPMIDGFNGFGCKQKLYRLKFLLDQMIEDGPEYAGEEEWLEELRLEKAQRILAGRKESYPAF